MLDCIVIGAGLSGLQAAYSLQQADLSVLVIEARDRVGGKVWSKPLASGQGQADLGAAWINEDLQPRIAAWCEQLGLKTVRQRLEGTAVMQLSQEHKILFPFGIMPDFDAAEKRNLEEIRDRIQAESLKMIDPSPTDDSVSLDQYVSGHDALPKTRQMVNLWSRVMHGVESTEQSAAWFIDYCRRNKGLLAIRADDRSGGNHQRIISGAQSVPKGIAGLVGAANIKLSSPVTAVRDQGDQVSVTTADGEKFSARKCIVSLPAAMYKTLDFEPRLPQHVLNVTDATFLGDYNKVIVVYKTPWWRSEGYNGFAMSFDRPVCVLRDTSVDEVDFFSLTCFVNGENGRQWSKLDAQERQASVLNQLATIFGQTKDSEVFRPAEVFNQIWKAEQFSQGALASITKIGDYTAYLNSCGKAIGNLHFVGTEYSQEWKGYMEGAICSGKAGAEEVLGSMRPSDSN